MSSTHIALSPGIPGEAVGTPAPRRRILVQREPGVVVFRCEACTAELHDLRRVFLVHRDGGWRIECSRHGDAEYEVDGGVLFGGGLHAVDVLAELGRARWFDAGDLFKAIRRLRAQESGIYFEPAIAANG